MGEENKVAEQKCCKKGKVHAECGGAYGLGMIAAAVYYIQHADSFWVGVVGVLKALVWPAFLVYKAMEFFKM